jgi:hypothetical protein
MKVSSAFPSEFLKSDDLGGIDGGAMGKRAVIADLKPWEDQQGNRKISMGFVNSSKRLLLNKTNARTLAKAYGDETDEWVGKPVIIYVAMVQYMDEMVEGLRVRVPINPPQSRVAAPTFTETTHFKSEVYEPAKNGPQQAPPVDSLDAFEQPAKPPFVSGLPGNDLSDEIPF